MRRPKKELRGSDYFRAKVDDDGQCLSSPLPIILSNKGTLKFGHIGNRDHILSKLWSFLAVWRPFFTSDYNVSQRPGAGSQST